MKCVAQVHSQVRMETSESFCTTHTLPAGHSSQLLSLAVSQFKAAIHLEIFQKAPTPREEASDLPTQQTRASASTPVQVDTSLGLPPTPALMESLHI